MQHVKTAVVTFLVTGAVMAVIFRWPAAKKLVTGQA